jgi:cell division protein FtsN
LARKTVTFRLAPSGVVLLCIGALLLAILIFAGGFVAGRVTATRTVAAPTLAAASLPAAPATAAPAPPPPSERLALRVGAFDTEEAAKSLVAQLAMYKIDAAIVPVLAENGTLFTVVTGNYTSRAEAANASAKLAREHGMTAVVVPAP